LSARNDFPVRGKNPLDPRQFLYFIPNGKMSDFAIDTPSELGSLIRRRRHELGLTQTDLADVARTTLRFISELEAGKPTAQLDGIMRVLAALGIELKARPR
jgi:HTH-type transcriptional regulator / antitoxin HipB